ncbi:hypothetical protein V5F53_02690 [Xanthobacter sp. V4C-4]|uniref:relaxase/mobilization nuclease domain-containing protein n=1 Tax=Xanthobacter cornucopiae TaxID=3119924 RepID=UPI003728432B
MKTKDGQKVHLLPPRYLSSEGLKDQIAEIVAVSSHGRTNKPLYHVHIDPPANCDAKAVIASFVREFEKEFGLQESVRTGVLHLKNGRLHAHLVYSTVRQDGRLINLSHEYARREKVCRIIEFEHGLELVKGKHNLAVSNALLKADRQDVVDAMRAAGLLDRTRPVAKLTPGERHQQERTKVLLDDVRRAAYSAWISMRTPQDFRQRLEAGGLHLGAGDKGPVVLDPSGSIHSLPRILSAGARTTGAKVKAASVRQVANALELKPVDEMRAGIRVQTEGNPDDTGKHKRSEPSEDDLRRSQGSARDIPTASTVAIPPGNPRGRGRPGSDNQLIDEHFRHSQPAHHHADGYQNTADWRTHTRWSDRASGRRLKRLDLSSLQTKADAIRNAPVRRMLRERITARALSSIDLTSLQMKAASAKQMTDAAGLSSEKSKKYYHRSSHIENFVKHNNTMTELKEDKTMIEHIAPKNPKARAIFEIVGQERTDHWLQHVKFACPKGFSTPARILFDDGGWAEIGDRIKVWGTKGKNIEFAKELRKSTGYQAAELKEAGFCNAENPYYSKKSTVQFWRNQGYDAWQESENVVWAQISEGTRIRDAGDSVTVFGQVDDNVIRSMIYKAKMEWNSGCKLKGSWSQRDQDSMWIEAQRQGVDIHNCRPSQSAKSLWEREKKDLEAKSETNKTTVQRIMSAASEAQDLLAAARGNQVALGRLPDDLKSFVSSYLDDDQRAEMAAANVSDVVGMIDDFKKLGNQEIESNGPKPEPNDQKKNVVYMDEETEMFFVENLDHLDPNNTYVKDHNGNDVVVGIDHFRAIHDRMTANDPDNDIDHPYVSDDDGPIYEDLENGGYTRVPPSQRGYGKPK